MLNADAPQLRTADQILQKNEQIADGLERGAITPKTAEQLGQCCKIPISLASLEMKFIALVQRFGRKAPVPRSSLTRSLIGGLNPEQLAPTDGEHVRALLAEK